MPRTTASVVVYRTPLVELQPLLDALQSDPTLGAWVVVDNAAGVPGEGSQEMQQAVEAHGGVYLASENVGFGAGHNLGLKKLADTASEFHVMVNPDILFEPDVLGQMEAAMDSNPRAVLAMPRVIYPDGRPQPLCKLLPTPFDFALRRFAPEWLQHLFQAQLDAYEMRGIDDFVCDRVPFLSGCFMFTRREAFSAVGGFDDRYFLYMEDVDLCRRLAKVGQLLYWPHATVVHGCYRGAYRSTALMLTFLRSAVAYFNRWGWIFDADRRRANKEALECLAKVSRRPV